MMQRKIPKYNGFKKFLMAWLIAILIFIILHSLININIKDFLKVVVLLFILYDFSLHFLNHLRFYKTVDILVPVLKDSEEPEEEYYDRYNLFWFPFWGSVFVSLVYIFYI